MSIIEKFGRQGVLLSLFVFTLSVLVLGFAVSSWADDADATLSFSDFNQQTVYHYDQDTGNGFKGWFDLTVTNNTNQAWGDYHFLLFDFDNYESSVIFVDSSGGGYDPESTTNTIDSWTISTDGKSMDLFFYSNPVGIGQTANFKVWTDNTAGTNDPFAIGSFPSVVPEPVSSTLFIIGGVTLGYRHFREKRVSA